MIIKITRGDDPAGLLAYLMGHANQLREGAEVVGIDNLRSFKTAPIEMAQVAARSERCKRPILQISVSLAPRETLSDQQWDIVWQSIDEELGTADHQKVRVRHDDHDHPHQHGCVNIINPVTGRTPPKRWFDKVRKRFLTDEEAVQRSASELEKRPWDSNSKLRLQALARTLEKKFGLTCATDRERWRSEKAKQEDRAVLSPGAEAREDRTGRLSIVYKKAEIRAALREPDWSRREAALATLGIGLKLYEGGNRRRRGIVLFDLEDEGNRCTGSAIGSDYSLGALETSAGEPLDKFLARRSLPIVREANPQRERQRRDELWERYLTYKGDHDHVSDSYRGRVATLKAKQDKEIEAEKAQQREDRRALAAALPRRKRAVLLAGLDASDRRVLKQMRQQHAADRRALSGRPAKKLQWTEWLQSEAGRGDHAATRRLRAIEARRNRVSASPDVAPRHEGDHRRRSTPPPQPELGL